MTTLVAFLDLAVCPVSFDAVVFMCQAEMERRKVGADRLHVVAFGEMRKKSQYDEHEAEWRFANIVIPAARLFGASISAVPGWNIAEAEALSDYRDPDWPSGWRWQREAMKDGIRHHLVGGLIERHKAGEEIARPRASEHARLKVGYAYGEAPFVTMTTRRTYLPERNSSFSEWHRGQVFIREQGFRVVEILDTDAALNAGGGFSELSLDLRMATYEAAAFNIVANTGPASLLWLSDSPYVMLGAGVPADEWDGLFVKQGLPLGASWPWALPNQRIAYGKETAEQIISEFERWESATS